MVMVRVRRSVGDVNACNLWRNSLAMAQLSERMCHRAGGWLS